MGRLGIVVVQLSVFMLLVAVKAQSSGYYDIQQGADLAGNYSALAYIVNATASPASDSSVYYLVNGVSNTGFWYQLGLAYTPSAYPEFYIIYAVFDPTGDIVYPFGCRCSGVIAMNGISSADRILLDMYFRDGKVHMVAYDMNTRALASANFSAFGATVFTAKTNQTSHTIFINGNGQFLTGPMTEIIAPQGKYSSVPQAYVPYGKYNASAWLFADEFTCSDAQCNGGLPVFYTGTNGSVAPSPAYVLQSNAGQEAYFGDGAFVSQYSPGAPEPQAYSKRITAANATIVRNTVSSVPLINGFEIFLATMAAIVLVVVTIYYAIKRVGGGKNGGEATRPINKHAESFD
jgi:hypothetical protein